MLPSVIRNCPSVHNGRKIFALPNEDVSALYLRLTDAIILSIYRLAIFQVIDVDDSSWILKPTAHHLVCEFHRLCLLRNRITFKCLLFRLLLCLWSIVVYPGLCIVAILFCIRHQLHSRFDNKDLSIIKTNHPRRMFTSS